VPAKAGDIVVFSSLTPHRTGPNLTADMRRAYILQYAPSGIIKRDAAGGIVARNRSVSTSSTPDRAPPPSAHPGDERENIVRK